MLRWLHCAVLCLSCLVSFASDNGDSLSQRTGERLLEKAYTIFFSNPDSALVYSTRALEHAEKNKLVVLQARAYHSIARTEILKGDIEPALQHLRMAADIFETEKQFKYLAKTYSLMSVAVGKVNNHRESVNLLLKSEALQLQQNDTSGLRTTYVNLANTYSKLNEYDKAIESLNNSKRFLKPGEKDWYFYYINGGIIYENKKSYSYAKVLFDSCLVIARRFNMIDAEITAATDLARVYFLMKQYPQAESLFQNAIDMARLHHLPLEEADALEGLLEYYVATNDYKKAYENKLRLDVISDSLFNIEKIKNISAVEAKLKVSEKEKTIALQKLEMAKSEAEREQSQRQLSVVIVGTIFLALVLFLTFYVYLKTRKQKKEVEREKARAEKLNILNQKIFAVIAHDFKSPMITLNMLLDLMEKENISPEELRSYSNDVRHQLLQSGQILENLLNWARTELKLSAHLQQESFPYVVTGEIVKELTAASTKKELTIHNEIPVNIKLKIPADILKIIVRNLLSNAVKFSYIGGEIKVGFDETDGIYVKDNGRGIDEKRVNELFSGTLQSELGTFNETGFGLGLYITHELVQKFNGLIMVDSRENSGTVFKFVFPKA